MKLNGLPSSDTTTKHLLNFSWKTQQAHPNCAVKWKRGKYYFCCWCSVLCLQPMSQGIDSMEIFIPSTNDYQQFNNERYEFNRINDLFIGLAEIACTVSIWNLNDCSTFHILHAIRAFTSEWVSPFDTALSPSDGTACQIDFNYTFHLTLYRFLAKLFTSLSLLSSSFFVKTISIIASNCG